MPGVGSFHHRHGDIHELFQVGTEHKIWKIILKYELDWMYWFPHRKESDWTFSILYYSHCRTKKS